jgi:hypothetical protein
LISSEKGSTIERRGLEKVIATRLLAYLAAYIAFPPSRFLRVESITEKGILICRSKLQIKI